MSDMLLGLVGKKYYVLYIVLTIMHKTCSYEKSISLWIETRAVQYRSICGGESVRAARVAIKDSGHVTAF